MMKRIVWIGAVLLALSAVAAGFAAYKGMRFLNEPVAMTDESLTFEIRPGSSFSTISRDLAEQGILERPQLFNWYARISGKASEARAGEYQIDAGSTPLQILDKIVSGAVRLHSFTIVEGWNFRELVTALSQHPAVVGTITDEDGPAILSEFAAPYGHPEGLFLPETYRFPKGTRDVEVLRQAYDLMQQALAEEWQDRAQGLPIGTPYEALVLASIIEKETARADERPRIAGVFVRRLEQRMRLQTDPTVIYGIGKSFDGNLTRRHLQTDTPYNTYTRGGLPPTPIAMPGRAAINAALRPAQDSALFFVATGLGDGSHKFSDTKEQHDAAVREYLARQKSQRNRSRRKDGSR